MGMRPAGLERQLELAKERVAICEKQLADRGLSAEQIKTDGRFKQVDAKRRQIIRRMKSARALLSRGKSDDGDA